MFSNSPSKSVPEGDGATVTDRDSFNMAYKRTQSLQVASNLSASFKFAWAGLAYAFSTQRNFRIHLGVGSLAVGLALHLHLPTVEFAVIGLTVAIVLTMELLNTALEALVDLTIGQTYHFLAKIVKDCAAGAVLISALAALLVASCLIVPPLIGEIIGH